MQRPTGTGHQIQEKEKRVQFIRPGQEIAKCSNLEIVAKRCEKEEKREDRNKSTALLVVTNF